MIKDKVVITGASSGTSAATARLLADRGAKLVLAARVVAFAIDQPKDTTVNESTVGPANRPW
jgi:NADP-dependent 3-hydroxy acid dehydrogenase YdfG